MNYKLAKQLKEAGFKQSLKIGDWIYDGCYLDDKNELKGIKGILVKEKPEWDNKDYIKIPRPLELIEACRDKNKKQLEISLHYVGGTTNHWEAKYMPKFIFTNGKSLEIAIAKLWLKLNEK